MASLLDEHTKEIEQAEMLHYMYFDEDPEGRRTTPRRTLQGFHSNRARTHSRVWGSMHGVGDVTKPNVRL